MQNCSALRVAAYVLFYCSQVAVAQPSRDLEKAEQDIDACARLAEGQRASCQEQAKLRIDLANAEIAENKLHADQSVELKKAVIQGITISGPIVAALIAAWYARKNFLEEQRLARESKTEDQRLDRQARQDEERLQFQLKAAETAMNATDSSQVWVKARILASLFPERLPHDFAKDFDPNLRFGPGGQFRLELLRLLMEYPSERENLVRFWGTMFPGDKGGWKPEDHPNYFWFNELMQAIPASERRADETKNNVGSSEATEVEAERADLNPT